MSVFPPATSLGRPGCWFPWCPLFERRDPEPCMGARHQDDHHS